MTPEPIHSRRLLAGARRAMVSAVLLLALLVPASRASTVIQRPLDDLVKTSPLVFEGHVTQIESEQVGKRIYTWVTLDILDVIKGSYSGESISLRYLGGSAGGMTLKVGDMRLPAFGERGIYLVESLEQRTVHPLRGWGQGHFILRADTPGGKRYVYNSELKAVTGVEPAQPAKPTRFDANTAAGVRLASKDDSHPAADDRLSIAEFKAYIRSVTTP